MLSLPFLPQGDVQVTVMLWGKNMLPASQQHYHTTVMISSIIRSNPTPTTGMVPATTLCVSMRWGACLLLSLPELPRPICNHSFPLTAITVSVSACVYLFAQLVLCSLYWQHQPKPTAVLPDSEPMCDEGPTLRTENKLQLLMNNEPLPPPFCQYGGHACTSTYTKRPKVKLFCRSPQLCFANFAVCVCVF